MRTTRVGGTGLAEDPATAALLLTIGVDPDLDQDERGELWDVIATGSLPILTTSEDSDIDGDAWLVVASFNGVRERSRFGEHTDKVIEREIDTLVRAIQDMPGVVYITRE